MNIAERVCGLCGVIYKPVRVNQKYCSVCIKKAKYLDMSKPCVCATCGKQFYKHREAKGIYCSQDCSRVDPNSPQFEVSNRQHAEAVERKAILTQKKEYAKAICALIKSIKRIRDVKQKEIDLISECTECGDIFQAKYKGQLYCSARCMNKRNNRIKEKRIYRNGKPDLSITLPKLFVRDNGVCCICGKPCDWNDYEIVNDSFITKGSYPTIDHIQPLSKGGLHSWDNVQLLCFDCNTFKRDKT